jgi:hypothetical protein
VKQQPIPQAALDDEHAFEMMRVWVAQKRMHTALNIGVYHGRPGFTEETAWGMMLADAARHVASALQKEFGLDPVESLHTIRAQFDAELDSPTTPVTGSFARKQ